VSSLVRRVLLVLVLLLPTSAAVTAEGADHQQPLNVLFIAVDDLRTELGCYGVDYAQTPRLDALAGEGVLFTNHFVQVPTCGASRYALLTGRSPARSGVTGNNHALYSLKQQSTAGAQSMPELFRRGGYHTICIGKISHTPDGRIYAYNGSGDGRHELPNAWDELATPFGPWKRGWGSFFAYANGLHREDGKGHRALMEFVAEGDEDLPDGLMARRACEKLREMKAAGKPFFLGVGFYKPHLPFVATRGDWEAMEKVDVPAPAHPDKVDSPYWHRSGEFYGYHFPFPKQNPLARHDQITARRAYLACVRYADRQIGRVLDTLDQTGLRDSTVVVVWGDHGWHLGESALWGKHTPFERAVHSTMMIRSPGCQTGLKTDALAETIDLYPTLVDLCGLREVGTEHPLDGRSLRPILTGTADIVRDTATSYWGRAVSLRTPTHRLIVTPGTQDKPARNIELYDIRQTPDPVDDLSGQQPELVKELIAKLPSGD
jgi:arylsulfatase A-like enzyme